MKSLILGILGILCGLCCSAEVTWEVLSEGESFRSDLKEVEWTGSGFVAVGENAILTSGDGTDWELVELDQLVSDTYFEIAFGPGVLVIGRETAVFSSDHLGWQQSTLPVGVSFLSAAGDGTQFLALGDDGSFYRSTDGLSWSVSGVAPGSAKGVAFGNSRWVSFNETHFYHSVDGVTWTAVEQTGAVNEAGESRYVPEVTEVDYSGGLFVANRILDEECLWNSYATSSDGVSWTVAVAPPFDRYVPDSGWTSLPPSGSSLGGGGGGDDKDYGPSLEINDVHLDSTGNALVIHSEHKAFNSYESYSETYEFDFEDSASSPTGLAIVVGNEGLIMSSEQPFVESPVWREVGLRDLVLVGGASDGNTVIGVWRSYDRLIDWQVGGSTVLKTENGTTWEPLVLPEGSEFSGDNVSFVNGRWFLAEHFGERLFTSTDAITWIEYPVVFSDVAMPVAREGLYGAGVYLAVRWGPPGGFQSQRIIGGGVSSDGIEWDGLPEEVQGAGAFGNGEFKVLQEDRVFSSVNGRDWTSEPGGTLPGRPRNLTFFNGRWIASGSGSVISNDCINWWPVSVEVSHPWWGTYEASVDVSELHKVNGHLISGNWPSSLGVSSDGVNWEVSNFPEGLVPWESATKTLPLGNRILGLGPNQLSLISSPISEAREATGLILLKPGFLEMAGVAGKEYRLLESSTLREINWSPVGDWLPAAADGQVLFWGTDVDEDRMFYRVEER